ncbi:hypothetical protein LTR62_004912 [Meristemomyces frigidus]|uniref:Nonsense-mediated mRNA decay factor n=1 Tax=Meristemomyces frigidus TaxID=1508187 RepID=A0AAN7TE13_9PEZI|nr:hypothetical protein LTR62_004912 [Meristemomyces frigidus]
MTAATTERSLVRDTLLPTTATPPHASHEYNIARSMEDTLARERADERHVLKLLHDKDQPIVDTLIAFENYRQSSLAATFADFAHADEHQTRLWQAHTDGRRYFRKTLVNLRAQGTPRVVEARQLSKLYKSWIKASVHHYREFVRQLSDTFGSIPELESVVNAAKTEHVGESSFALLLPEQREIVLKACHQVLIYLGDLSRYRASDELDTKQDWAPALGFYGLAHTILPANGLGQHQQAVVALERRAHLSALYHLYRSVLAAQPHPAALKNLKLEFGKIDAAWDKLELIPKLAPNDPEAPKQNLTGWFVRMHSLCVKGETFNSHAELEREVLAQLAAILRKDTSTFQSTVMRMVMVNLAAQYHAGLLFQGTAIISNQPVHVLELTDSAEKGGRDSGKEQQAFYYFFRLNIKTYTILLQAFSDCIRTLPKDIADDLDLSSKLTPVIRRLLPSLRLYSSWLTCNLHLVTGLAGDVFLGESIDALWISYARVADILADDDIFGIWALDEYDITYTLEEDVDTIAFTPLQNGQQTLLRNWQNSNGTPKLRFSGVGVMRASVDEEMVARVKGLLADASYLAHEVDHAPIGIVGDRIYYGQALQNAILAAEEAKNRPPEHTPIKVVPKPLSYAAAAKSARAVPRPTANGVRAANGRSRQAQVTRMVDNLVDEDEGNNPVTPPQQHIAHPAVVTNGEGLYSSAHYGTHVDFANVTSYQPKQRSTAVMLPPQPKVAATPPPLRTPTNNMTANSVERLQSVASIWNGSMSLPIDTSPSVFPSGLPTGTATLASPAVIHARPHQPYHHSRGNSANSIRSRGSVTIGDSWSSLESAQPAAGVVDGYANFSETKVASPPLLFGAQRGIWSTGGGSQGCTSPPAGGKRSGYGHGG